jgi:Cof subfamily protein (haloacid dehalogenase superfamily)
LKYKLIVSDLDGTLLDSKRNISIGTRKSIDEFRRKGGFFTIATGRMELSAKGYIEQLEIDGPVILYNGSRIIDINRNFVIYDSKMNYMLARKTLELLKEYEWDPLVYVDGRVYVNSITPVVKEYMEKDTVMCDAVGNLYEFLERSPTKILIIGPGEQFESFAGKLSRMVPVTINCVRSEPNYLEILPDGVSKGAALRRLAGYMNIPMDEVVAIGDQLNDLEMIKAAGLGVAVENACSGLKSSSDYVTFSNDEEGVAEVVFKVINGIEL